MLIPKSTALHEQGHNQSLQRRVQEKLKQKPSKLYKQQGKKEEKEEREDFCYIEKDKEVEILQLVESYQCIKHKGYFNYEAWMGFIKKMFDNVPEQIITQLWKILRVINYGEIFIPTGLVYEIAYLFALKKQKKTKKQLKLRQILNIYLQKNKKSDSLNTFREISSYLAIEQIQKQFIQDNTSNNTKKSDKGTNNKQNPKEMFVRLYKQDSKRKNSLSQMQYQTMVNQIKQCTFTPHINNYKSHLYKQPCKRICHHDHSEAPSVQKEQQPFQFKFRPVDEKIYQCDLLSVPGANEHICRNQYCQAERQKLKRFIERPFKKLK